MAKFDSRIHVLLAREAPNGLVIRRGPSKCVATLLWNRETDEFQLGQWFKGRIYERRSDLSPDGKHFLSFAMNGKLHTETHGSWTAISHAPFLKALAIFPKGDCWHGGGLWTGRKKYWLNDGAGHTTLRDNSIFRRDKKWRPTMNCGGECLGVYYPRLLRDGWIYKGAVVIDKRNAQDVFEKRCSQGWIIRKIAHRGMGHPPGKGCYWDEHELIHPQTNQTIAHPDWEWADLDRERLVWAVGGKLLAGRLDAEGLREEGVLYNFNEMSFTRVEAPY